MPLVESRNTESYNMALWNTTEESSYFAEKIHLSHNETAYLNKISNPKRKKEWLSVRHILQNVLCFDEEIQYTPQRRPHLKSQNISISHSGNMVAVIVSKHKCAVDVEQISPRVAKISHKAFSQQELTLANTNDKLTALWCIKETVFKFFENPDIDFINDIEIKEIDQYNSGTVSCLFSKENIMLNNLTLETIGDYKMVWIVDN